MTQTVSRSGTESDDVEEGGRRAAKKEQWHSRVTEWQGAELAGTARGAQPVRGEGARARVGARVARPRTVRTGATRTGYGLGQDREQEWLGPNVIATWARRGSSRDRARRCLD